MPVYICICISCMYNLWYTFSFSIYLKDYSKQQANVHQMYKSTKLAAAPVPLTSIFFWLRYMKWGVGILVKNSKTDDKDCHVLIDWFVLYPYFLVCLFACLFLNLHLLRKVYLFLNQANPDSWFSCFENFTTSKEYSILL